MIIRNGEYESMLADRPVNSVMKDFVTNTCVETVDALKVPIVEQVNQMAT